MSGDPLRTIADLRREALITDDEIAAAVEAYLIDPGTGPYRFASNHVLDVGQAVREHRPTKAALAEKGTKAAHRRALVRAAVILAVPTKR